MSLIQLNDPEIAALIQPSFNQVNSKLLQLNPLNSDASGNPLGSRLRIFSGPLINGHGALSVYDEDGTGLTGIVYDSLVNPPPISTAGLGGVAVSATYVGTAGAPVSITLPSRGTYLFVFKSQMTSSDAVAAGCNVSYGVSDPVGIPIATAYAPVPVTNGPMQLSTNATAIGVVAAENPLTLNFVAAQSEVGGGTSTFSAWTGVVQAVRLA